MGSDRRAPWLVFVALVIWMAGSGPAAAQEDDPDADGFDGQIVLGYRSVSVSGSENKYREDIDLEDGPVLFDLDLRLTSEALNGIADEIVVDLNNLGSQPFETMKFGVRKFGTYKFSYDRRASNYFYNDVVTGEQGVPVTHARSLDTRRVRDVARLDLFLTDDATLSFGFDTYRRTGDSTGTPRLRRDVFVFDGPVDESLQTFSGSFTYSWDKVTLILEERIKEFDNAVQYFAPGALEGPSETVDFLFYDTPYSYDGNEHVVRVLARPNDRWDIRFSGEFHDLDLHTDLAERWAGTDRDGIPVERDASGNGTVQRDLQLLDLDVTYLLSDRLGLVGGIRRFELDQNGSSEFDGTLSTGDWNIETTGLEIGAQYLVSKDVTVTGGLLFESRDVNRFKAQDGEGSARDVSTDNVGLFVDASWRPSRRLEITADLNFNSYDDPFTLASATDRQRIRLRGKYRWDEGFWLSGSYSLNDYENTNSGWQADNSRAVLRLGYNRKGLDVSAGYSNISTDRSIDQLLNGDVPRDILYAADSDFVDAQVRWSATPQLALVGSAYLYENTGTFGVDRQDYRAGVEYLFPRGALIGLGYRSVDYSQDEFDLNDYDAEIVDFSIGYRW